MNQISLFDGSKKFIFDKPIRLIELFAGVGSQAMTRTRGRGRVAVIFSELVGVRRAGYADKT